MTADPPLTQVEVEALDEPTSESEDSWVDNVSKKLASNELRSLITSPVGAIHLESHPINSSGRYSRYPKWARKYQALVLDYSKFARMLKAEEKVVIEDEYKNHHAWQTGAMDNIIELELKTYQYCAGVQAGLVPGSAHSDRSSDR